MTTPTVYYTHVHSLVGRLRLVADARALRGIGFEHERRPKAIEPRWQLLDDIGHCAPLAAAQAQLAEYFAGTRRAFDLPLNPIGTAFQREVWQALADIPYGSTLSYGELARRIGKPAAVRAVGAANGRNPLPIVLPCHRVIGSNGSLTGFAGGLPTKRFLLELEGCLASELFG